MQQDFRGWDAVSKQLQTLMDSQQIPLNDGQKASLRCLAGRLTDRSSNNGMIIADEVGMGKTRIAAAVARAVTEAGGRVAVLVPPGLGYQWNEELRCAGVTAPPSCAVSCNICVRGRIGAGSRSLRWSFLMGSVTGGWEKKATHGVGCCSRSCMPDGAKERRAGRGGIVTV